jgi:hypothetical protein
MEKIERSYLYIIILFFIIVLFSYRLYKNMTRTSKEGQNPVIGILTFKNKLIQRKFDSEVIWDEVNSGIEIRNRDTIRTGDYSDALLTLNDKSKININENSMIYLDFSDSAIINFAYGSLSLVSTGDGSSESGGDELPHKDLKIASGDKVLELGKSSINLAKNGKDDLKLQVTEGTAKIIAKGKETTLKENEVANLTEAGIEISEINLFPNNPVDLHKIYSKTSKTQVDFDWTTTQAVEDVRIEVSKDSKFSSLMLNLPVKGNSVQVSLDPGLYYWRLSALIKNKKQRELSVLRKIHVFSVSPPEIVIPEEGKIFKYSSLSPLIEFSWKKNELFKDYSIEISKDPSFNEILRKVVTSSNFATIDKLPEGKFYARILAYPVSQDISIETSLTSSFTLESTLVPDPPKLNSPFNNTKINGISIEKGLYVFQWKDNPEIKEYLYQISQSKKFDSILYELKTAANQVKPNIKLNPGNYFWRVKATNKENKSSEFSEINSFEIKELEKLELIFPSDKNSFNLEKDSIMFSWKKNDFSSNFIFEIASDQTFQKKIVTSKINSNSYTYKFTSEGDYYWRVVLHSDDGSELLNSPVYSITIENNKDPNLISPRENERIDMSNADELIFKWEKIQNADSYILEILDNSGNLITKIPKLSSNQFIFKDLSKLEEGNFKWSIQAVYRKNENELFSQKKVGNFKIYLSDKPIIPMVKDQKKFYVE